MENERGYKFLVRSERGYKFLVRNERGYTFLLRTSCSLCGLYWVFKRLVG